MARLDRDKEREQFDQLAASHHESGRYRAALRFYGLSASVAEVENKLFTELPIAFHNLARAHQFVGEYEYAIIYYHSSVRANQYLSRFEDIFDLQFAIAHCWCALGEMRAMSVALRQACDQNHFFEFNFVQTDSLGYPFLVEAMAILHKALSDHPHTSQQRANSYALMRHINRLTGKFEEAMQLHRLCLNHGGSEYDTIGHGFWMAQEDKEGAIAYLEGLLEQPNVDQFRKRDAHSAIGLILALNGKFQEAREHHLNALRMSLLQRCSIAAMITYFYLGQVDHRAAIDSPKSPLAQSHYQKGLSLAKKLSGRTNSFTYWNQRALPEDALKRSKELYQYRLELAKQDPIATADALVNLNECYIWLDRHRNLILESTRQALDLISRLPEGSPAMGLRARCYSQLGRVYWRFEKHEKVYGKAHEIAHKNALDSFDRAIDLQQKLGDNVAVIELRILRAIVEPARREDLQNSLRLLEEVGGHNPSRYHQKLKAEIHVLLLSVLRNNVLKGKEDEPTVEELMCEFALCEKAAKESFDARSSIEAYTIMAGMHKDTSYLFLRYSLEEEDFKLQDDFYEDLGLSKTSSLTDVRKVFRELHVKFLVLFRTEPPEAEGDEDDGTGSSLQPYRERLDWMSFRRQELTAAESMHLAHLDVARRRGSGGQLAQSLSIVGAFYENIKSHKEAQKFLEEAARICSNHLGGVQAISSDSLAVIDGMQEAYQNLLSCIAAQKDCFVHEEGLVWAERLRARTLLHTMELKLGEDPSIEIGKFGELKLEQDPSIEIGKFDTDKQFALKSLKDMSLSCPDLVFVEYALLSHKLLIWVVRNGSIVMRQKKYAESMDLVDAELKQIMERLPLDPEVEEEIEKTMRSSKMLIGFRRNGVRAFIKTAVAKIRNSVLADSYLDLLGGFLLGPVIEDLASVAKDQCIVFIPHEELVYVPFAALRLDGDYLIRRYQVAVSMSLRAYAYSQRSYAKIKRRGDRTGSTALLVSNPFPLDTSEAMGLECDNSILKPLASAEKEAQSIVKCMKQKVKALQVVHLSRDRAQKVAVMKVLPDADWVHFACHGFISEVYPLGALPLGKTVEPIWFRWLLFLIAHICMLLGPWLPSFVYQRAGAAKSVGILGAEDTVQSEMQARCVILNVCNSAKGQITADGVFNWSHTLQQAGVPSIVLSLWEVQDLAACKFMTELYNHLANNEHLGVALQKVMVTMINDGENWQPKHWASYSIIGVPQIQLPGCEC